MESGRDEKRLIVGVDYGTTHSGVSYVWSTAVGIESVHLIDEWGTTERTVGRAGYYKQVPSRIAYEPELSWGYDIGPEAKTYCWTKLLLDRFATHSEYDDSSLKSIHGPGLLLVPTGKTPEDVVTDFLTQLYSYVMSRLKDKLGPVVKLTPIEFWFTLPALWSLRAEDSTRKAAIEAGFESRNGDSIRMVREPEAGAIACLSELIKDGESPLVKVGDGVLVCDCGGGTVDLASYKVLVAYPIPSLEQACVSEGGKCGSTTIDRAFHRLMEERFGSSFSSLSYQKTGAGSKFMTQFESIKRHFGVSKLAKRHLIDLNLGCADSQWYRGDENEVVITTQDMIDLFDPVVKKIIALLEQQIQATRSESELEIKTICLVGGFGESIYLLNKLREWCPDGVELINPNKSWEAICIGAALRGLEGPIVVKKKSKRHIGLALSIPFDANIHNPWDAYYDQEDKMKRVMVMDWMINRGQSITSGSVVTRSRYWTIGEKESKIRTQTLYESTEAVAPGNLAHPSVQKLGELYIDLRKVDLRGCQSRETGSLFSKKTIYRIEFSLEMMPENDLGYIYFRVICSGKVLGEARLEFSEEDEDKGIPLENLVIS
ncbi:Hsp70 family heat shock protein [Fusarium globosum]|uniref:Hsp70 family heat shock protein n=1 Tax=Fusarium globosum TaxID=78864 RepID=A0A8H5Y3A4_9HYPO|nr:Hsp70 family heat shock protein [Fusarium globosum]